MINIYIVLTILFFHWLADFVLQSEDQAKNKSTSWSYLISHTVQYSLFWIMPVIIYAIFTHNTNGLPLLFIPITFIAHTATDYYTSRVNKVLWDNQKVHDFFVSIGFDQFLHFVQLLLTYYILTK